MRRLMIGMVVAAVAALVPLGALAGNQEVAERIAASLRDSGKLQGYSVGIEYQDGIARLKGQVSSRDQMRVAVELVSRAPGVTRVVNELTVASQAAPSGSSLRQPQSVAAAQPITGLRPVEGALAAERVPTSFASTRVRPVNATALQEPTLAPPQAIAPSAPQPIAVQPVAAAAAQPTPSAAPAATGAPLPIAQVGAPLPIPATAQPMPAQGALPAGASAVRYDQPNLPNYAWPGYAAYPNYAAVTYPRQYSPTAWPYIGPFYPYPQVPLGWRKVTLEWHDGWWNLDFDDGSAKGPFSGLFRPCQHR